MLESIIRPRFQQFCVNPIVQRLPTKLSPLWVTIFAALTGTISALFIIMHHTVFALLALALSGYCDILDGSLARQQGSDSPIGAVSDILCDRYVEFVLILALFLFDPMTRALPTICMLGAVLLCVTSFLVVGIFSENKAHKSFHYSQGLMERAEAFLFFAAMTLWPKHFEALAWAFVILVLLTTLMRTLEFMHQVIDK